MRIAIHNSQLSYYTGGTERLIFEQINGLLKYPEVKITLISSKAKKRSSLFKKLEGLKNRRLKIALFEMPEQFKNKMPYTENSPNRWHLESIEFGKKTVNFYKNKNFDLIITHFSSDSLFIPRNLKNILHLHGVPTDYSDIGEISTSRPDYIISVSKSVRDGWIKFFPSIERKIKVIYPGINSSFFRPTNKKRDIDVLFVGRLIKIKGIYNLIESLKRIKPDYKAVLIGKGPEGKNILAVLKKNNLINRVSLISDISDLKLLSYYNRAKVSVFPSYAKEGMVLTMLEAASCSCAVITSNCCSMPEFIKPGINGLLVEPNNPLDLSLAITNLLEDNLLRERLGKKAREEILTNWRSEERVEELYHFYKDIASHITK